MGINYHIGDHYIVEDIIQLVILFPIIPHHKAVDESATQRALETAHSGIPVLIYKALNMQSMKTGIHAGVSLLLLTVNSLA
jgi:hypothetical protein